MGRALWRELVIGFAGQLGELRLGFTQLAALYVLADGSTLTVGELAEAIGRSPSATSRLVDGLVRRRLVERHQEPEDRRQRTLRLTQRGHAVLRVVDRARADQFLSAVRPLPTAERAIVAMGVAALATHAISRRGRLIRTTARVAFRARGRPDHTEGDRHGLRPHLGALAPHPAPAHGRHVGRPRAERRASRPGRARSRAGVGTGTLYLCKACGEGVVRQHSATIRPTRAADRRGSAAEAAHHVVEDRQTPAQRVDRDPLVDAVEPLQEALVGVEPER